MKFGEKNAPERPLFPASLVPRIVVLVIRIVGVAIGVIDIVRVVTGIVGVGVVVHFDVEKVCCVC
jgi:hypothetical protein